MLEFELEKMNFGRLVFDKFEFWVTRHKKKTTQLYKHLNFDTTDRALV